MEWCVPFSFLVERVKVSGDFVSTLVFWPPLEVSCLCGLDLGNVFLLDTKLQARVSREEVWRPRTCQPHPQCLCVVSM